jgi:hypothetical protein
MRIRKANNTMNKPIRLSEELITNAEKYGHVYNRTIPKQIEYWAKIGKITEENPDLPYNFIKDVLIAKQQLDAGTVLPYEFDE